MPDLPRIESAEELAQASFLKLRRLHWRDAGGVERRWETAERNKDFGAVLIFAWLRPSERLILIRQYRPPADRFVYELPAGLIDAGETPEQAAARELREETGYTARTLTVGPSCYTSPGLSNESVAIAAAEVDENSPANAELRTEFDPSENIDTFLVARADLQSFYENESSSGNAFDAKLASYILGLSLR